ncbi:hypothetical protein GWI33_006018 [Rhynchophorus ferrugineus]|uniref:Uncharacterized protein n=1 Tax=Rhynchophorus ferrugineus TaxID=354439 RepID=A0A834IWW5_RHYFE|nr:hypothetical protein GWI33_006018 [Rhynchophorus ferrugineus]
MGIIQYTTNISNIGGLDKRGIRLINSLVEFNKRTVCRRYGVNLIQVLISTVTFNRIGGGSQDLFYLTDWRGDSLEKNKSTRLST